MPPSRKPPLWFYEFLTNDYAHLKSDVKVGKIIGGTIVAGLVTIIIKLFVG